MRPWGAVFPAARIPAARSRRDARATVWPRVYHGPRAGYNPPTPDGEVLIVRKMRSILIGILAMAGPAMAQTYDLPQPKTVSEEPSLLYPWLFGLAFLVGCLVVAFKPAKRANLQ